MAGIDYRPQGDVLKAFLRDDSFVRAIRGPVGSGKSVACAIEGFRRSAGQAPDSDGIRRSRGAVIRRTNPQLETTTIKTWLDWMPEMFFGRFVWSPPYHQLIKVADVEAEVWFLALDKDQDIDKLQSLELTWAWVNEAREVPKSVIDMLTSRVGRYPSMKDGGPTWYGVFMDTNAPSEDHWWPIMAGEAPPPDWMTDEDRLMMVKPDNWKFFTQPPAMLEKIENKALVGYEPNPNAENVKSLVPGYYENLIRGKKRSWINIYVLNKLGSEATGKSVYPSFSPEIHVSASHLEPEPNAQIQVGIDFGLTPAAIFAQEIGGRWFILRELTSHDMGIDRFCKMMKRRLAQWFPDHWDKENEKGNIKFTGDPAGDHRAQTDERTPFSVMRANGLKCYPANTNDFVMRVEGVEAVLGRLIDGKPAFLMDKRCVMLKRAMEGAYHYPTLGGAHSERFADRPQKDRFSHPAEALQYLMVGGGEARRVARGQDGYAKPRVMARNYSPFDRHRPNARKPIHPIFSR